MFVFNKLSEQQLSDDGLQRMATTLDRYFAHADFRKNGVVSNGVFAAEDGAVNFYCLPRRDPDDKVTASPRFRCLIACWLQETQRQFRVASHDLRDRVLSMPKLSPCARITERDWLRHATQVWKDVKLSQPILEYKKILAAHIT